MAESERRMGPRVDVEFFAIELSGEGRFYRLVRNVSEHGLYFETPPGWYHDGTAPVVLELEPEIRGERMRVEGTVAHATEHGVGLRLVDATPSARAWLRRLLAANA